MPVKEPTLPGHSRETEVILLVMTDGEPSDVTFDGLKGIVQQKVATVYVTFLMCTEEDDVASGAVLPRRASTGSDLAGSRSRLDACRQTLRQVVGQYNKYLDRIPGVDITDDYMSEKQEVEALGRKLSYYKWMAKAVLGGKMPKYDHMDEKRAGGGGGCCVIA